MKTWQTVMLLSCAILFSLGLYVFSQFRSIEAVQLSEDLYVLQGLGGNTAVLRTEAGNVVVDTMLLPMQGERIRELAQALTGADTVLVINTHYHLDHTHGNPAFAPGTRVLATERTLSHLQVLDEDFWQGDAAALLPNETFSDSVTIEIGGKTLDVIHPGVGHTDGDLVVLFRDEGVLHTGDLMFHHHYPSVDLEAGGSIQQWVPTLEALLTLDFTRVIPGHGEVSDRAGLRQFLAVIAQLAEVGRMVNEQGLSLEQTLDTELLTADEHYEPVKVLVPMPLDREYALTRVWEEATGNYERLN